MKDTPVYWWRDDAKAQPVSRLRRALNAAGPDARFEMKVEGDQAYFRVIAGSPEARSALVAELGEDCEEWVNDSRLCPPVCP